MLDPSGRSIFVVVLVSPEASVDVIVVFLFPFESVVVVMLASSN